jgi:hypothetical protein
MRMLSASLFPVDSHAHTNMGPKNSSSYLPVQQQELNYMGVVTLRNSELKADQTIGFVLEDCS